MNKILVISDLHLSPLRPETLALFKQFTQELAPKYDALYILGDFFDYWIGDDDTTPFHRQVFAILKALTATDTPVFFMHGNRDFLVGKGFEQATGAKIIGDPTRLTVGARQYILMHGDTLCTDDKAYQFFRTFVRNRFIQTVFRLLPLSKRREIAHKMREKSKYAQKGIKPIDVNLNAVKAVFKHFKIKTLIHGHTHRPKVHRYGNDLERIVLSDWHETGSYIAITDKGPTLNRYATHSH